MPRCVGADLSRPGGVGHPSLEQFATNIRFGASSAQVSGLLERVVSVETLAWYVVIGWRLFVLAGSRQKEQGQATPVRTMEHKR